MPFRPFPLYPGGAICPGKGNTIAPKHSAYMNFFVHGNFTGVTTGLVVFPFGPKANKAVWTIPPGYGMPPTG